MAAQKKNLGASVRRDLKALAQAVANSEAVKPLQALLARAAAPVPAPVAPGEMKPWVERGIGETVTRIYGKKSPPELRPPGLKPLCTFGHVTAANSPLQRTTQSLE